MFVSLPSLSFLVKHGFTDNGVPKFNFGNEGISGAYDFYRNVLTQALGDHEHAIHKFFFAFFAPLRETPEGRGK